LHKRAAEDKVPKEEAGGMTACWHATPDRASVRVRASGRRPPTPALRTGTAGVAQYESRLPFTRNTVPTFHEGRDSRSKVRRLPSFIRTSVTHAVLLLAFFCTSLPT